MDIKRKETPAVSEGGKELETNGTHDDFIEVVLDPCHKDTHPEISSEVNIGSEGPNEEYRRGNMHNVTFELTMNYGILDDRVVGCGFMGHQDFGILFDKDTSERLMARRIGFRRPPPPLRVPLDGEMEHMMAMGEMKQKMPMIQREMEQIMPMLQRTRKQELLGEMEHIMAMLQRTRKQELLLQRTRKQEFLLQWTRKQELLREMEHIILQKLQETRKRIQELLQEMEHIITMHNIELLKKRREMLAEIEQEEYLAFLTLLAYTLLFCTMLIKSSLKKQSLVKYSFVKAAMMMLWTSGDVEKHPGPPLNDMKTVRELYTRLVKISQGNTVADWSTAPANWDQNVVSFRDINNKKEDSDNEEKYAMFYEALCTVIKNCGCVPGWCIEEMPFIETGNAVELPNCQTARKVRELLEQHHPSDHEDICRRAGYPRQGENISAPEVSRSTGQPASATKRQKQRQKKCPFNLPEFKPIAKITDADTPRQIAKGCMMQSKKRGKYQNGSPHQQTATKRPASTTPVAPKRRRVSPTVTNTGRSTSTVIKPNISSTLPSVVPAAGCSASTIALPTIPILYTLTTSTSNVGSDSSACQTPKESSEISTGAKVSTAHTNLPPNHSEQSSNDVSRGTPDTLASDSQQPGPSGQPPNKDSRGTPGTVVLDSQHPGPSGQPSNDGSRCILDSKAPYSQQPGPSGHPSNDDSRGTPDTSASNSQQPGPSGQPPSNDLRVVPDSTAPNRQQPSSNNLISLPSEDLDDLGFSSDVHFDKFLTQILKDSKI